MTNREFKKVRYGSHCVVIKYGDECIVKKKVGGCLYVHVKRHYCGGDYEDWFHYTELAKL